MKPKINLPSGGSIVIESTEALTVIDVNCGKFTGGRTSRTRSSRRTSRRPQRSRAKFACATSAASSSCDFIDMASNASRNKVVKTLEDSLRKDRTRTTIQSFSALGLLEFTRKRVGKDLAGQLRGACPTCAGMGSVMSPESVAIETFRQVRAHTNNGAAGDVRRSCRADRRHADRVLVRMECEELARAIGRPVTCASIRRFIRRRRGSTSSPASISSARTSCASATSTRSSCYPAVAERDVGRGRRRRPHRRGRKRAPTTRATVKIRILDVDDEKDYVLAELVTAGEKPRRRRARRAKPTAAEEARQLRELAEDAARQSASRPPIGISAITEEEEAQDKAIRAERKGEAQPDAIIIAEGAVQHAAPGEGDGRRKRRRRRRARARTRRTRGTRGDGVHAAAGPCRGGRCHCRRRRPPPARGAGAAGAAGGGVRRRGDAGSSHLRSLVGWRGSRYRRDRGSRTVARHCARRGGPPCGRTTAAEPLGVAEAPKRTKPRAGASRPHRQRRRRSRWNGERARAARPPKPSRSARVRRARRQIRTSRKPRSPPLSASARRRAPARRPRS